MKMSMWVKIFDWVKYDINMALSFSDLAPATSVTYFIGLV